MTANKTESAGNSLLNSLKTRLSEPERLTSAAALLMKMATAVAKEQEFSLEQLSKADADDLGHLLEGIMATLKSRNNVKPELVLRKARAAEKRLLDEAKKELNIAMLWRVHIRALDTEKGPIIVVEPNGLNSESFREFAALETAGWRVSVDGRFAAHFPGHAVCVLLRPPRKLVLALQPKVAIALPSSQKQQRAASKSD